ncbi:uncharacterized protein LOC62_02G001866 [Vanrija pseudolonga]|uniref:Uncharacterized protein n=1 Tax=Vanrija pseudolonga TaxID=143232 RepID=A0AAF0Y4Y1_9TREE|nr:hypothetical protein LOC62_02G001866 [Vanrija pseudolonga]
MSITTTAAPAASSLALDTYSGLWHGHHDQCCVSNEGQYTNLTQTEFNTTAPPGFHLQPNMTSEVIGHCHVNLENGTDPSVGTGSRFSDFVMCLFNGTASPLPLWYGMTLTMRNVTVAGGSEGNATALVTYVTGTATATAPIPSTTTYDVETADFYSGIHLDTMASCCKRLAGQGGNMTLAEFNATVPEGFYLRANISGETVAHCRLPGDRSPSLATCLRQGEPLEATPWYVGTSTDANGTVTGWTENVPDPWRTFSARPSGASATTGARSSAVPGAGQVKLGLISLLGMAAAAIVSL